MMRRTPRQGGKGKHPPHDPIALPDGGSSSPTIKSARSPGGTRVVDVTMTGTMRARAGGVSEEEQRRLAEWKAKMAAEGSDDDFPFGKSDDEGEEDDGVGDEEADAILSKFGAAPAPAQARPQKEFDGEFNWDGFKQVHTITEQNQELMRQMGEKDAEIERWVVASSSARPVCCCAVLCCAVLRCAVLGCWRWHFTRDCGAVAGCWM